MHFEVDTIFPVNLLPLCVFIICHLFWYDRQTCKLPNCW